MPEPDLRQLKESRAKRLFGQTYKYYVPIGVGEKFIENVSNVNSLIDLFSAANGVGKTALAVNILAHLFWPCGSEWFEDGLFVKWPYPKRARIASDPATIVGTIIPALKEWFPKGRYTCDKQGKHYEAWWKTDTGWELDIMTYEQKPSEFESATIGLIWLDEPPPEYVFTACVSRLRRGGKLLITQTPIGSNAIYLYDRIILNKDNDKEGRTYLTSDVEDACIEHGERGFLKHSDIERMIAQYPEDEKLARIHGKYAHTSGLIYKQFEPQVHIIRPFKISAQEFTVYEALDTHPRVNDAATWMAVDEDGTKFIIDELSLKCQGGTEELAGKIKQKAEQYRLQRRICEPAAFVEDQHGDKAPRLTLAQRLSMYGLHYEQATKNRTYANRRLGDALNYEVRGSEIIRTPEMYIFNTCPGHIYEITHYRWDDWRGKSADTHGRKEKPVDKDDHYIENVGRLLVMEPQFVPYVPHWKGSSVGEISAASMDPYD